MEMYECVEGINGVWEWASVVKSMDCVKKCGGSETYGSYGAVGGKWKKRESVKNFRERDT